jgi:hypothetical protein
MKMQSELYIQELVFILHGINLQVMEANKIFAKHKRKMEIMCLLTPWRKNIIRASFLGFGEAYMAHVSALSELREKALQSHGLDDDMRPITFSEMIDKNFPK